MRVALVHNYYRSGSPSGENQVVDHQIQAMARRGIDVHLIARRSDDLVGDLAATARAAAAAARFGGADVTAELAALRPDVVHVHNTFPGISGRALARWPGPLVATLHNYRPVCARAVLFRDGHPCTLCPDDGSWHAVRHRCYRESVAATVPLAWRTRNGVAGDPLLQRADGVVVLSEPARQVYARYGLDRMRVIPNATPDHGAAPPASVGAPFAAVGRLSAEKGFERLIDEWPKGVALDLFGSGELEARLRTAAPPDVTLLGGVPRSELVARLADYAGVVVPGVNPEGAYPQVVVEAWSRGRPVVARAGGVAAAMITRWGGGAVYRDAADLPGALAQARALPSPRPLYDRYFSEDRWVARLLGLYAELRSRDRGPGEG